MQIEETEEDMTVELIPQIKGRVADWDEISTRYQALREFCQNYNDKAGREVFKLYDHADNIQKDIMRHKEGKN